jgi:hypothetical protein
MSFVAVSRKKHHKVFVSATEEASKVGRFNPTYGYIDGDRNVRTYGTKSKWDGHMKEQASKMKDESFWKTTKVCDRI